MSNDLVERQLNLVRVSDFAAPYTRGLAPNPVGVYTSGYYYTFAALSEPVPDPAYGDLKMDYAYCDSQALKGSNWTAGAAYGHQTVIPEFSQFVFVIEATPGFPREVNGSLEITLDGSSVMPTVGFVEPNTGKSSTDPVYLYSTTIEPNVQFGNPSSGSYPVNIVVPGVPFSDEVGITCIDFVGDNPSFQYISGANAYVYPSASTPQRYYVFFQPDEFMQVFNGYDAYLQITGSGQTSQPVVQWYVESWPFN
jgi:hypothetical protein